MNDLVIKGSQLQDYINYIKQLKINNQLGSVSNYFNESKSNTSDALNELVLSVFDLTIEVNCLLDNTSSYLSFIKESFYEIDQSKSNSLSN